MLICLRGYLLNGATLFTKLASNQLRIMNVKNEITLFFVNFCEDRMNVPNVTPITGFRRK